MAFGNCKGVDKHAVVGKKQEPRGILVQTSNSRKPGRNIGAQKLEHSGAPVADSGADSARRFVHNKVCKAAAGKHVLNLQFSFFLINIVGNTLLFVPIGVCLPLLWNIPYDKVMLIGLCYSLFIEVTQMFMPRVSDVDDIILNCLGVFIGIVIHSIVKKRKSLA